MKSIDFKLILLVIVLIVGFVTIAIFAHKGQPMLYQLTNKQNLIDLFALTPDQMEMRVAEYIVQARKEVENIVSIDRDKRTYKNTVQALDALDSLSNLAIMGSCLEMLEMVSPQAAVREKAHEQVLKIQDFGIQEVNNNKQLYNAIKEYADINANSEDLNDAQKFYLQKVIRDYKQNGLDLRDDQLQQLNELKKELAKLELEFSANIAKDNRTITVTKDELRGLSQDFINSLTRSGDEYVLGIDYPTLTPVLDNCSVAKTRKKLLEAFNNRAYPVNEPILKKIIAKRDELAHKLGFASYAELNLSNQMAKNVETVEQFINELFAKALPKAQQEFELLTKDLPENVQLSPDNKIYVWDSAYVVNSYKKKYLNIDEQEIAQYFPTEKTIEGLLDIYHKFFGVTFKELSISGVWHEDVKLIETYDKNNQLLGYLLLDLYPRANKFSHACHGGIVPAVATPGKLWPAAGVVIANFPKSTKEKPALLKRNDVNTFFHEFGHALHALFGRTEIASLAGTRVKTDFVEMPSQMLEEWLWDKEILKNLSSHYQTGLPMPDELIERILKLKNFTSGSFVTRQLFLATFCIELFAPGADKNLKEIFKKLFMAMRIHSEYDANDHMYASFGHLTDYAAKYYGYMWSKVFALDLFSQIKEHGLLNPHMGQKYIDEILSKGGTQDPNELLENFLGRKPNQKAFLQDLGLN